MLILRSPIVIFYKVLLFRWWWLRLCPLVRPFLLRIQPRIWGCPDVTTRTAGNDSVAVLAPDKNNNSSSATNDNDIAGSYRQT